MKVERRIVNAQLEVRAAADKPARLVGYAAVFNRDAVIGGFFRERIAPGAFATAIKEDDVRALFNHDPNIVLGRNTAGTLSLSEDETGLQYDVEPPDTQLARDLMVSISRGDVSQSSFGFQVVREEWSNPESRTELPTRTILEARLFDVSPVTYPAYEETTAEARAKAEDLIGSAETALRRGQEEQRQAATALRLSRQRFIEATL
jgi:HK97 family phage prohead protease